MRFKLIVLGLAMTLVLSSILLIIELRRNYQVNIKKNTVTQEWQEIQRNQKESQKLRDEAGGLGAKLAGIQKRVPYNSDDPLELLKDTVLLGGKYGVKNLEIVYEKIQNGSAFSNDETIRKDFLPFTRSMETRAARIPLDNSPVKIKTMAVRIDFDCEFTHLVGYLKEIMSFERVISIKKLEIKRLKEIIPRQKVLLEFNTYTFVVP
ncbi:MAG: hypothetical protein ABH858_05680 [Candidatus Omnitrophota bacterium]